MYLFVDSKKVSVPNCFRPQTATDLINFISQRLGFVVNDLIINDQTLDEIRTHVFPMTGRGHLLCPEITISVRWSFDSPLE